MHALKIFGWWFAMGATMTFAVGELGSDSISDDMDGCLEEGSPRAWPDCRATSCPVSRSR